MTSLYTIIEAYQSAVERALSDHEAALRHLGIDTCELDEHEEGMARRGAIRALQSQLDEHDAAHAVMFARN